MKAVIQSYGLLFVFSIALLVLPQVLHYAIIYRQVNSVAIHIVELIEVHDGITSVAQEKIDEIQNSKTMMDVIIEENRLSEDYHQFNVTVKKMWKIGVIQLEYVVESTKKTKKIRGG